MSHMTAGEYAVPTYRNTKPDAWWALLNEECRKLGIADRTFSDAHDAYEMGQSPSTAAAEFASQEASQ